MDASSSDALLLHNCTFEPRFLLSAAHLYSINCVTSSSHPDGCFVLRWLLLIVFAPLIIQCAKDIFSGRTWVLSLQVAGALCGYG